jgi:hypothetical protein
METQNKERILEELNKIPDVHLEGVINFLHFIQFKTYVKAEKAEKWKWMEEAVNDPVYLADLRETHEDFSSIDSEIL